MPVRMTQEREITFRATVLRAHPMGAARIVRRERYAWPGGYPLALLLADGELLCPDCVAAEWAQVSFAHRHHLSDGWRPAAYVILDDPEPEAPEICAHCGKDFHA